MESAPFTLYTDGGEKAGRQVLERLDLARRAFGRATPLPVRVFLLSEKLFQPLKPGATTRGFYQSAAQRDSIVLPITGGDRVVFHEYAHLVLHHTSGPLPKWLEEGLAEFHSTLAVVQGKLRLGRPIPEHLRILQAMPLLRAADMPAATAYHDGTTLGVFYAQSWALVHMLRLSESYRKGFQSFLTQVERGESQAAAFQQAFGKSFSEAVGDLKLYLDRPQMPVVDLSVELGQPAANTESNSLTGLDADLVYAELARDCGRPKEAERIYERLARQPAGTPLTESALGYLALGRNRFDEARARFEKAIALGSRDAAVAFELAMLVRDHGGGRAAARPLLERVVDWNPDFAEAQFLLGVEAAHENRHEDAVRRIERAVAVFPRQSYFWHALAMSYQALGRTEAARTAAKRAQDSAATPDQAEMARALLRGLDRPAGVEPQSRPDVIVPESWKPKQGESRVEGVLERIDCLGQSARFIVRSPKGATALWVENPGDVLMKNLSSLTFEFRCGPQKPVAVVVEYRAQPDRQRMTQGAVTAIEFR
jgi:tetratricopeptide (TPR) repeat protein